MSTNKQEEVENQEQDNQEQANQEQENQEQANQEQENQQKEVSPEFVKVLKDLVRDILVTFPEYKEKIQGSLRRVCCDEGDDNDKKAIYDFVGEVMPERFFDILYQNADMFDNEEVNTEFLPNIDFSELWKCDISDKTRETIWKYLQLLLFSVIGNMTDGDSFKDTAKLFEAINEDEFKSKLEETVNEMQGLFNFDNEEGEETNDGEANDQNQNKEKQQFSKDDLPDPEKLHEHVMGMMDGKLGNLAKEIAEETAEDMCLNIKEGSTVNDVFEKLFKNPGKLMGLVKNVGTKLDEKIKEGDIKESELISEATEMMSKMQNMPGMNNISSMFEKMAMAGMGGMGGMGGKGGKVNMNAFQSHMNSNLKQAKMRERMQEKLQRKNEMQQTSQQNEKVETENQDNISDLLNNDWLHMDNDKLVFSMGQKAEKTPARSNKKKNKNRKKKKKNKN